MQKTTQNIPAEKQRCSLLEIAKQLYRILSVPTLALIIDTLVATLVIYGIDRLFGTQIGAATLFFIRNHWCICIVFFVLAFLVVMLLMSCLSVGSSCSQADEKENAQ